MAFHLRAATDRDLTFARTLTHEAMNGYYTQYGLLWSNDGFDTAWAGRENWLICRDDSVLGFVSLSRDSRALYIRELHLLASCRKQGAGSWVLEQMALKACAQGLLRAPSTFVFTLCVGFNASYFTKNFLRQAKSLSFLPQTPCSRANA